MDAQWHHEQMVFRRFLACVPELRIKADSISRGEGYDLACLSETGERLAFELTEITDNAWAAHTSTLLRVPQLLNQRLREGDDRDTQVVRERYRDRDIAVTLGPGAGPRTVKRALPRFFEWLATTDPDADVEFDPPAELHRVIRRVEARHFPGINGLCFHVSGQAMWIGDDSVATVAAKFEKDYPAGVGLQLLAYFHRQLARPDAAANVRTYLDVVMRDATFGRVWLYDDQNRHVLLRYS